MVNVPRVRNILSYETKVCLYLGGMDMEFIIKVEDNNKFENLFDSTCLPWTKDRTYNLGFLRIQEEYFNDRLKLKGHLFLNEVYDELGFSRTKIGQVAGWINEGGSKVDFGLLELSILDESPDIPLHFNCKNFILDIF